MWGYAVLIYEVFNGNIPSRDALKQINNVTIVIPFSYPVLLYRNLISNPFFQLPELVRPHYPALIAANPKSRTSPSDFIKNCTANRGFFHNNVIDSMSFLDEIQVSRTLGCVFSSLKTRLKHICFSFS